ncbi:MAG: response regulator transcription factor [Actinobacteria bacterium]|nr:response regulator transcription factor [Actinomycetota bacterium]
MNTIKRVLIIDDHAVVRQGIRSALESYEIYEIFEAGSKSEALAQTAKIDPDAMIVDINLPDGNGLEIVSWARTISKTLAIVVLSFNESNEFVIGAMKAGASAFLNKSAPLSELKSALEFALLSPEKFSAKDLNHKLETKERTFGLSQRELQILTQLYRGEPLKELASSLFISEATLKTHLSSVYRKLHVNNRVQAIEKARVSGIT